MSDMSAMSAMSAMIRDSAIMGRLMICRFDQSPVFASMPQWEAIASGLTAHRPLLEETPAGAWFFSCHSLGSSS